MRIRDKIRDVAFGVICIFIGSLAYGESVVSTVAGNGTQGFSGDNGLAIEASLNHPQDVNVFNGKIYIADKENHRIRKVDIDGIITTIVGNGVQDFSGDDGLALDAGLSLPYRIDFDSSGNMFIADNVDKLDSQGIVTTVISGLNIPLGLDVDDEGNVFVADRNNNQIKQLLSMTEENKDNGKVTICHKPGTKAEKTLNIRDNALNAHLGHGDTIERFFRVNGIYEQNSIDLLDNRTISRKDLNSLYKENKKELPKQYCMKIVAVMLSDKEQELRF